MDSFEMDRVFKSLLKKVYLTDVEFQKIMDIETLENRKSEILDIMMVKDQATAVEMFSVIRRMTARLRAKENHGIHPLLNAVVADRIFGFLPMKDILNCRLVCHQWRTASSNILRKRITINFKTQGPYKFFEDFENCLDINFQYFKFLENNDGWNTTEIEEFFEKYGTNIKRLRFSPKLLFKECKDMILKIYDITPLILKACNLTKLKVVGSVVENISDNNDKENTLLEVHLAAMSPIKFISVEGCLISIHDASEDDMRIKPLKISLNDVAFKTGETIQQNILLNDVIDFSLSTKLNLYNGNSHTEMNLDMKSQILRTQSFHLKYIKPKNWVSATGIVYFFYLHGSNFKEKNGLQIQQLYSTTWSKIKFSALPITIEKLHFADEMTFESGESINLSHLKYLRLNDTLNVDDLQDFSQCPNLVELELGELCRNSENVTLNTNWIPKSVQRIKIHFDSIHIFTNRNEGENVGLEIEQGCILNLDTLILEDYLHCLSSDVSQMMSIIKPKILVVSCIDEKRVIDTTSICEFVYANSTNRHLEKLIVGSKDNLHKKIPFELSVFSRFVVKKKANYYQFENHKEKGSEEKEPSGTPISKEEFDVYTKMDELDQRFHLKT